MSADLTAEAGTVTTSGPAVRVGRRAVLALVVSALIGVAAFGWPLLVTADSTLAHGQDAPWVFGLLLTLVLAVVLAELTEGGMDAKAVAMLGVLSAVVALVRPLGAGTAGIETTFFLVIVGGRVFGPGFGFALGNTALFASALLTAGVGPWLPFQMLGSGWIGLGAGLLPAWRGRPELALLACYGAVTALLYGMLLNLSFWPFVLGTDGAKSTIGFVAGDPVLDNLRRLIVFSAATSLGWDIGRAITTVVLLLLAGPVLLRALRRAARRASFQGR